MRYSLLSLPPGLRWDDSAAFRDGTLHIDLAFDGRPMGTVRMNASGVNTTLADLRVPASDTLSLLPGALGRAE